MDRYFGGRLDDVRIFSGVRSDDEIRARFADLFPESLVALRVAGSAPTETS